MLKEAHNCESKRQLLPNVTLSVTICLYNGIRKLDWDTLSVSQEGTGVYIGS